MIKKLIFFLTLIFAVSYHAYSLNTYVGVNLVNLSDDPTSSCSGESGYGSQGRIRALSSILPNYPIYMEIRNSTDSSVLHSGNVSDGDYHQGEAFYFPTQVDLIPGETYEIFFDVDAIKVYLNTTNWVNSRRTADDLYWTVGDVGSSCSGGGGQTLIRSVTNTCDFLSSGNTGCPYNTKFSFSGDRSDPYLEYSTGIATSPDAFLVLVTEFELDSKYLNLYQSSVGNFQFQFIFN